MNIETALRELQSFGNTPEDMSAAISIAWVTGVASRRRAVREPSAAALALNREVLHV